MSHPEKKTLKMPLIGLGTWRLNGEECVSAVKWALELGYRHIDTAMAYENHKEVGRAIQGFDRSQLYITTKLRLEEVDFDNIEKSVEELCDQCLQELQIDYIDLFLIHSPDHELPMERVIFAMEKLRDKKKIGHIGVSNFTIHHMQDLLRKEAYFSCNQVEFHPYLFQEELWDYAKKHHVQLVAYRSLGKGALLKEPLFQYLGGLYNKTAAQIILRWTVQRGIPVIPKAADKKHLEENLQIFDFVLTEEEMQKMDALHRGIRYAMPDFAEFSY